jgi:predicted phage tail protein
MATKALKAARAAAQFPNPTEQPDDLQSVAKAKILVALGKGSLQGS